MKRTSWARLLPFLALLLLAVSCYPSFFGGSREKDCPPTPTPFAADAPAVPASVPSAGRGEAIYEAQCAECHGETGRGDGPVARGPMRPKPPDFTDSSFMRDASPARFFDAITNGVFGSSMLAFEDALCFGERWDVLFYTWAFSTTDADLQAGRELYTVECAGCHGRLGQGDGSQAEQVEAELPDFTRPRLMVDKTSRDLFASITTGAPETPEHTWQEALSEDKRWQIVHYLWTFLYEK